MAYRLDLPDIYVIFTQKAVTAVQRSERGVLCVIMKDKQQTTGIKKFVYKRLADVTNTDFETSNFTALKRAFDVAVNKVYVLRCSTASTLNDIVKELDKIKFNYVCTNVKELQQDLANQVVQYNRDNQGHKCVAVVANPTQADSKYVIKLKGTGGKLKDGSDVKAEDYLIRIASTLCNLPMNRSLTFYVFEDLASWDDTYLTTEAPIGKWISDGWLTLINDDDEVKCGRAINSLTTFTSTDTEDMSYIIIVEAMNLIIEDIYTTFKDYYVGKYKNTLSNQRLFITSVNAYLRQLMREEVLDDMYDNHAYVDIESQRLAWLGVGKTEAGDWDDNKVQQMTFRTHVFLAGDAKISNAMEDLKFVIALA
jgi:phage tail sheath protein|nr:MAG TPA: tail sheath protein [Caudoviricetes sp.]